MNNQNPSGNPGGFSAPGSYGQPGQYPPGQDNPFPNQQSGYPQGPAYGTQPNQGPGWNQPGNAGDGYL